MVPSIFVNGNGDVELVTGAAGGTKITTATALVGSTGIISSLIVMWYFYLILTSLPVLKCFICTIEPCKFHYLNFEVSIFY
jgi:hypothetical protein